MGYVYCITNLIKENSMQEKLQILQKKDLKNIVEILEKKDVIKDLYMMQ